MSLNEHLNKQSERDKDLERLMRSLDENTLDEIIKTIAEVDDPEDRKMRVDKLLEKYISANSEQENLFQKNHSIDLIKPSLNPESAFMGDKRKINENSSKDYAGILIAILGFLILISFIIWGYSSTSQTQLKNQPKPVQAQKSELYEISSFLKNTIYAYPSTIIYDLNYTPTQQYHLKGITVEVRKQVLTVKALHETVHKVLSAKFYQYHDTKEEAKIAVMNTNRGMIILKESTQKETFNHSIDYSCYVEQGNYKINGGGGASPLWLKALYGFNIEN